MSLITTIQSDLASIADDMSNPTLTWNSEDYSCIAGGAGSMLVLGEGGYEVMPDVVLYVSRALFTDNILPKEQQKLQYRDKGYRIAKVILDPVLALVRLGCLSTTKGV